MAAARAFIFNQGAYYGPVLYELTFQPVKGLGTMATTAENVVCYDPKWVDTISIAEVAGTVVHEMHHVIRSHLPRMKSFAAVNNDTLNIAADLAINPQIIAEGWELPFKVMPSDYGLQNGLTFEEYVHLLSQGAGKGRSDTSSGAHSHGPGSGKCGGVVGNPCDKERSVTAPPGKDPQRMSEAVKECVRAASNHAPGPHQAWWKNLAAAVDTPVKVPWRTVYRGLIAEVTGGVTLGCSDYTYSRRSRRQLLAQYQLPKLVEHRPEVCVILDTSGSMNDLMGVTVSETKSLLRSLGIERIWLLQADTRVRSKDRVGLNHLKEVPLKGGGGTSFDQALLEAGHLTPRPDFTVYLTDGWGSIHTTPPVPTIFCVFNGGNAETLRKFGKVVEVTSQ